MSRNKRLAFFLFPFALFIGPAASPAQPDAPDDLVRQANGLFRDGDKDAADALYARAEERTADPGLVAFNRGTVLFDRGRFREAADHYDRALKDDACPPGRAARAWYNRGTCLLRQGGSWDTYRRAVACFEHALDSPAADDRLRADARHNIELAKLLCAKEREKDENKKKSPNTDVPPEEDERPRPRPDPQFGGPDTGGDPGPETGGTPKSAGPQPQPVPGAAPKPTPTDATAAGNNANLQVLRDDAEVQPLTPADARANLAAAEKRIRRDQQSLLRTLYGPERTGVRDW